MKLGKLTVKPDAPRALYDPRRRYFNPTSIFSKGVTKLASTVFSSCSDRAFMLAIRRIGKLRIRPVRGGVLVYNVPATRQANKPLVPSS